MSKVNTNLTYSTAEAARLLSISEGYLRLLERRGAVKPARSSGGHRQFTQADLQRVTAYRRSHARRAPRR